MFYVAATRAERNLWLLSPHFYVGDYFGFTQTTMFLKEIEDFDSLVETVSLSYEDENNSEDNFVDHINDFFS